MDLGVASNRIVQGTNSVDTDLYRLPSQDVRRSQNSRIIYLYVGQYVQRKGVSDLIEAFRAMSSANTELHLLGYGPLEKSLKKKCASLGLTNVRFQPPTTSVQDTAARYWQCDVLVLPSHNEVWGLVVNEALAAGLYVVVSDACGCAVDLVERARIPVGSVYRSGRIDSLVSALKLAEGRIRHGIDRHATSEWGCEHTVEKYAKSIYTAVNMAVVNS